LRTRAHTITRSVLLIIVDAVVVVVVVVFVAVAVVFVAGVVGDVVSIGGDTGLRRRFARPLQSGDRLVV
jgi:hypothetical protein